MIKFNKKNSYAYLMGVYLGDGEISKKHKFRAFRLNTKDKDFANTVIEAIQVFRGDEYYKSKLRKISLHEYKVKMRSVYKKQPVNYFTVFATSAKLFKKMSFMTTNKTKFPREIFKWSKEQIKYFIIGMMDSEACCSKKNKNKSLITPTDRSLILQYKITDKYLFLNVLQLMKKFRIKFGKIGTHQTKNKIAYRVTINIKSWIDAGFFLNLKRKQDLINKFKITIPYTQRSRNPRIL